MTDRIDTTETRNPPPESSPVPALEETWKRTGGVRRRGEVFAIRRGRRWTCAQAGARSAEARRSPQAGAGTGNTAPPPTGRGSESARPGDIRRMGDQPLAVGGIDRQFADPGQTLQVIDAFKPQQHARPGSRPEIPHDLRRQKKPLMPRTPRDTVLDPSLPRARHAHGDVLHTQFPRPSDSLFADLRFPRRPRPGIGIRWRARLARRGFALRAVGQEHAFVRQPLRRDAGCVRALRMDRRR